MRSKRVILDTNLLISFLITNRFAALDRIMESGRIRLIFSEESIAEFVEVAARPRFRGIFTDTQVSEILRVFESYGELVQIISSLKLCRDSKDDFLLNLAIDGNADFLVTGDTDLLDLRKIGKTEIVTFRELITMVK